MRTELIIRLQSFRETLNYESIFILGSHGERLLGDGNPSNFPDELKPHLGQGDAWQKPQHSNVFIAHDGKHVMYFVAPLRQPEGTPRGVAGHIVSCISLDSDLFPRLKQWPNASSSGETFLVQRDKDDVVYLSAPRDLKNRPQSPRIPLSRTDTPAVRAVLDLSLIHI